ncbi:uncharacterized protein OCT59_001274 [Rhizophagus irregularis]|uniref:Galactose oxidase n=4 Tax=Rhizophagus irregularis TaxID=588596 RepID=A0A2P4PRS4_RHIID|nr:hypothetical protein GLOIN_2v1878605 [Rhizophagus irregularis DAOM 181602=DAOM 197198]PKY19024.1 galactose oxidase [Rhizophagus irregularis]POG68084.1 hypothetical protein GLOIN_2v1878605 [Rhizophagus irregularis DAOM 181602=DAOM 197198]UZO00020.1 hypothetical protein OCT59_001274 [Rhizophagus irregularis]|eukprot:XP_025174950.1 hypothetical protein GLOIN_2v1878605 [Rhizophagus irregularis DAOM 181602=DAOM 197198]
MYKNLNYYMILIILSQLFNIIIAYGQKFIPEPRLGVVSVLIEDRIYYIGGDDPSKTHSEANPENDIFYLDLNIKENFLTWVDLKVKFPIISGHAADVGGINQDSIFIIGGNHYDEKNTNYFYRFDTKTNELSVPVIQGKAPPTRVARNSVSYEGKMYLFGGRAYTPVGSALIYVNQLDIFDTVNLIWQVGSIVNSPGTLSGYTATLVNGIIYYIGGRSQQYAFSPMTEIYQYDIVADKWSLKKATTADTNAIPGPRAAHSAVLFDGKIYVYGGLYFNADTPYDVPAKETFVMLDTVTLVWSVPPYNSTNAPKLAYHSASLKGALLIFAFGIQTDLPQAENKNNNSTYYFYLNKPIIDWSSEPLSGTKQLSPSSTISIVTKTPDTPTETALPSSQYTMGKMVIVGTSVASVLVVLTIIVACSLIYKRIKSNQKIKRESNNPDGQGAFNGVEIPPDGNKHSYLQQYPPVYPPVYQQFAPQQLQPHSITGMPSPPIQQH